MAAPVLGLTGKNVFARLLAGNVPVELIKNTRAPVLILRPDWNKTIQALPKKRRTRSCGSVA